jgi:phage baseplate assembly protein gpV
LAICQQNIKATDIVWTNTTGGNWNVAANWSPNTVPGATDSAIITNSGTYTVTINAASTVTNLTLGGISGTQTLANASFVLTLNDASFVGTNGVFAMDAGATLTGNGNLTVQGILNWTGGTMSGSGRTIVTNGATLNIAGFSYGKTLHRSLDLFGNGSVSAPSVIAGNGVFFNVFGSATLDFTADYGIAYSGAGALATLQNSGTVKKSAGAGLASINLAVTNNGTFRAQSGTLNFQNSYRQNSGVTTLEGGGYQALLLDIDGGALTGAGTINGPVRNNSATAPGNSLGQITLAGANNFTNTAAGTYFMQIGGTNRGVNYDSIAAGGTAVLSGSFNLSITNGFVPPIGSIYTAMTFTARSGVFTNSNANLLGFVELYTPTNYLLIASNGLPQIAFDWPPTVIPL